MTNGWRDVYRQEKRRPGYVIENGKSIAKIETSSSRNELKYPQHDKSKAA